MQRTQQGTSADEHAGSSLHETTKPQGLQPALVERGDCHDDTASAHARCSCSRTRTRTVFLPRGTTLRIPGRFRLTVCRTAAVRRALSPLGVGPADSLAHRSSSRARARARSSSCSAASSSRRNGRRPRRPTGRITKARASRRPRLLGWRVRLPSLRADEEKKGTVRNV